MKNTSSAMDDRSAMEKLERFAADVNARKTGIFGYPANCPVHLKISTSGSLRTKSTTP
ncbi:MAG: hypothetical protein IJQ24_10275 [Synergistaceae bacterium]|nr:hypothetical protein [Synergistaceae bacterium]